MTGKLILKFIGINIILFIVFSVLGFGYVVLEMYIQKRQNIHGLGFTLPQPIIFFKAEQNAAYGIPHRTGN
jgi:hypothetical protein